MKNLSEIKNILETFLTKNIKYISVSVILSFSVLTLIGFFQLFQVKTNYNFKQFFPKHHFLLNQNEQVKDRFDIKETSPLLLVATLHSGYWIEKKNVYYIKSLNDEISKIPNVKKVSSIANLKGAISSKQELGLGLVIDHLNNKNFENELKTNPILAPFFISKDGRTITYYVNFNNPSAAEVEKSKNEIFNLGKKYLSNAEVKIGGVPAIQSGVNKILNKEIIHFVILAFFLSLIALSLIFKNISPIIICTVLSLVTNILSIWSISAFGFAFNVLSSTIPILVTMTVVSVSLHSILRLIENEKKWSEITKSQKIVRTFIELFRPNLLTSLTTSVGFFTLTLSDSPIIKEFGLSVGIALLVTWINTAVLLPMLLQISDFPKIRDWMASKATWSFIIFKNEIMIFILVVILSGLSAWKGQYLAWNAKLFDDLPENNDVRKTTELVDQSLGGLVPLEVELRIGKEDSPWSSEKRVRKLDEVSKKLRSMQGVGSVLNISDILKTSGLRSGRNVASVSEVMFLLSMSDENPLHNFMSSDSQSTRLSIKLTDIPGFKMWYLVQEIKKEIKDYFPEAKIKIAGTAAYIHDINNAISLDLLFGFWQAMLVIFLMLIFTYRSFRWAVLACIPNLTPPALLIGALAIWKIPIKPGIAIILSISLGLAFNNTVYLLERMRDLMKKGFTSNKAMYHTFWSEANPCFFSSLVLIIGFAGFGISYFKMNQLFGVFMVLSVVSGLLGDLVLLPALLKILVRYNFNFNIKKNPNHLSHKGLLAVLLLFSLSHSKTSFAESFKTMKASNSSKVSTKNKSAKLSSSDSQALKALGELIKKNVQSKDESGEIKMKIIDANGGTKDRDIFYSRLSEKGTHYTMLRMLTPKDIKGTSLLSVIKKGETEDKWIYLPSSKQTRKITTTEKSSRVLDSELYTEDFDLNNLKAAKSKILSSQNVFLVETLIKNKDSLYSRSLLQISKEGFLQKAELYDKKNKLLKVIQFSEYISLGKNQKYRARKISISNVQNKRKTELTFSKQNIDQNLRIKNFTTRALAEGI